MKRPIFVPPLDDAERKSLEADLRSPDAFTLRRCQILLANDRGENAYHIARALWVAAPRRCATPSISSTRAASRRPLRKVLAGRMRFNRAFDSQRAEALREMLNQSPRNFGKESSLWTLDRKSVV